MILSDLTAGMYVLLRRGSVHKISDVRRGLNGRIALVSRLISSSTGADAMAPTTFVNFKKNLDHQYADRDTMVVFSENPITNLNAPVLWARSLPDERAKHPTNLTYQTYTYFTNGAGGGAGF